MRNRGLLADLAACGAFLLLALLLFGAVTVGGKTLIPADNVFQWAPWQAYAEAEGISFPHNGLVSDLYLENYAWKQFIVDALQQRELPLWNPYILTGVPFLAAGQHSVLYPLSVLFYILPLSAAYGWFAALHLFLAGLFTYRFARTLSLSRGGAFVAGVVFELCGFIVISNVFPMIVAAAVWLPVILIAIEHIVQRQLTGARWWQHLPDVALGAVAFGLTFLAGHPEMYFYVGLVAAIYALFRLIGVYRVKRQWASVSSAVGSIAAMALVGVGLGCAQWLPLLAVLQDSVRESGATLAQVRGWALPKRHVLAMVLPDVFGNPAHHRYWELFAGQWRAITRNALGEPIDNPFWGIKNYVEGAAYVGTLTLLLVPVALLRRKGETRWFWAGLGMLSLLFSFGTPLYALIYALPGFSQVRTPFRWIYVYSFCAAMLAGLGADALGEAASQAASKGRRALDWLARRGLGWLGVAGGIGVGLLVAGALLAPEQAVAVAERAMALLDGAERGFSDARMFLSYQVRNLALFGGALFLGGGVWLLRPRLKRGLWYGLAGGIIAAELLIVAWPFFPANDRDLVAYETPAIRYLQQQPGPFRITALVSGDEKTFNANAGMFYGLEDIRGYDSIIPRQYASFMSLLQEQTELQYNRIAPLYASNPAALNSPLLDLLNVRYVLTSPAQSISADGWALVYDGELRIYENRDVLPRAFMVATAENLGGEEQVRAATALADPLAAVLLEQMPPLVSGNTDVDLPAAVIRLDHGLNEVTVEVETPVDAYLVLTDAYASGWKAFVRSMGAEEEQELTIYRAYGQFRAVAVPAGHQVVRFKYTPNAVKFGLYVSFMAGMILVLGLGLWLWRRFYREPDQTQDVQRVTKNTVAPIALNVMNKVIDMVFAMLMLRLLGPAEAGNYYFAVVVISWFDILTNFGLNTLVTREVARAPAQANRYLLNTIALRGLLWLASIPVLAAFWGVRAFTVPLDRTTALAIALFFVGLLPSNISASYSAIFNAHEKMEIPASVATLTTLLRVCLGTVALVIGSGYVGLAVVSIIVNIVTLLVLRAQLVQQIMRPSRELDRGLQRDMLRDAWPLMINQLLATLFFKMAVMLLEILNRDPRVLGWYSTAYKYIDAVGLIPAYFTLALFPLMARYAASEKHNLVRAYRLAIKVLSLIAVGLAALISAFSTELIAILGGSEYLPHAAEVLRVMIWYMPIGFINSVTQYVLIALDQQRFITRAFAIALAFNIVA
ncbi:MAG: oligosaccharide flippase family protein, partial [Anaerolineales bacterium]